MELSIDNTSNLLDIDNSSNLLDIDNSSNLLVIDTSYYIFHRYYATLKWYTYYVQGKQSTFVDSDEDTNNDETDTLRKKSNAKAQPLEPIVVDHENLHKNEEFVGFFKKHFLQDLEKLKKRWTVKSENIIFCKDCSRETIWRNAHHTNYKGTRVVGKTFNGEIFPVFYNIIVNTYKCLCLPQLEADDIVYLLVNKLLPVPVQDNPFKKQIIVITNDNDYLQMRRPNLQIYNLIGNGLNLETRSKGTPEYDLLLKVIMGDTSDNIQAICAKMGPKTAAKIAIMSEAERIAWIAAKGPACVAAYENNKRMVDFRHIPAELQSGFYGTFKFNIIN